VRRWFRARTLVALAGSVALPLVALAYLAARPGKGSAGIVLLQVAIVAAGLVLTGLFLSRLIEQMKAARVARWLESAEGRDWLEALSDEERERFFDNWERWKSP